MSNETDMVQCEVTGNWIPADEVITFQGKRVGAEGKAILLERLRSGSGEPGEMVPPTVSARFGGLFVDGLIASVVAVAIAIPILVTTTSPPQREDVRGDQAAINTFQLIFQLVLGVLIIIYYTYFHSRRGQTPGKRAARTKVVMLDGSPLSTRTAFLRAIYYYFPNLLTSLLAVIMVFVGFVPERVGNFAEGEGAALGPMAAALMVVSVFSSIYVLSDILVALFDRARQRAIHDRLAGTRVIRVG